MIVVKQVEFKDIEKEWRQLEQDGHVQTVFQTYDWIETWWKYLGYRGKALILGIYDGPELIGIAPLYRYSMRVKGVPVFKMLGIMGTGESDYNAFVLKKEREAESLNALLSYLAKIKWDIFWLSDVHSETTMNEHLETALRKGNYNYVKKVHTTCPYIVLPDTFEKYKKSLSSHTRQNMINVCNKVMKLPGVEIRKINEINEIEPAIIEFIRLHQNRWHRVGQNGALANEEVRYFHIEAAARLFRYLDLKQLMINKKVIATTYSYDYKGSREFYLPGMDLEYKQYRLGTAMIVFGIQDAIKKGLKEFDFLRGDEEYKYHFTKTVRNNVALYFGKSKLMFKLFCLLEKIY